MQYSSGKYRALSWSGTSVTMLCDWDLTADELAAAAGEGDVETVYHLLQHLAANGRAVQAGDGPAEARFAAAGGQRPQT